MGRFLAQELNLSKEQLDKINGFRKEHFETTSEISKQIAEKKKIIMHEVFSENSDKEKVSQLADEIGKLNTQMEEFLFNHFIKMKSVMNKEQVSRFENLVYESMRPNHGKRSLPGGGPGSPPPSIRR